MDRTLVHDLREAFRRFAARPALEWAGEEITYQQLEACATEFSCRLASMNLRPGDRVGLFTSHKPAFIDALLGSLFSGQGPLFLNPSLTRDELQFYLRDSGAKAIVLSGKQRPLVESATVEHPVAMLLDDEPRDPHPASLPQVSISPEDPSILLYSSGTTGWPKGVLHSQRSAAHALAALGRCWQMTSEDVVLNQLPLFHIHGGAFATLMPWLHGAKVLLEESFQPGPTMESLKRSTVYMAVPTMYYRLLDQPGFTNAGKAWSRMRLFTCGSAPIRAEVLPMLESALGKPIINRYGMSEAFVISSLPLDGPHPHGSVGQALDGMEIEIRPTGSDEAESDSPAVGSVWIRGDNLFREYLNRPEATAKSFHDGWFETGDLGYLDDRGFLFLVGRKNDLIITAGFNVYPQVVERVLSECPGVKECAVVGLPDRDRGEVVAAAIVRASEDCNADGVLTWLQERLVYYQRPKVVRFVDALPKNHLGKLLRKELQRSLSEPPGP